MWCMRQLVYRELYGKITDLKKKNCVNTYLKYLFEIKFSCLKFVANLFLVPML